MAESSEDEDSYFVRVKKGRPSKLPPELEATSLLPPLEAEKSSCASIGDEARCFSFRCIDCMPRLALEYYNQGYMDKLKIVPSLASMIGNVGRGLFDNHAGYRGEVIDFYSAYVSQIEGLAGIAVNGFNSCKAKYMFDQRIKKQRFKDFEIDWLLFTRNSVNIFEVGRNNSNVSKCEDAKSFDCKITKKLRQAVKSFQISRSLLTSTGCTTVDVNLFVFFQICQ